MAAQILDLNRSLGYHAEFAHYGGIAPPGTPNLPWNSRFATDPPLVTDAVTKILFFPGNFHWPHREQLRLLDHVFKNGGYEADFQAAIIFNMDNDPALRNQEERINYWHDINVHSDRYWVYDGGDLNRFRNFVAVMQQRLKVYTEIELYLLAGGDEVSATQPLPHPARFSCKRLITSEIGRGVDFRIDATNLRQLPGCTGWRQAPESDINLINLVRQRIAGRMAGRTATDIANEVRRVAEATKASFSCTSEAVPGAQSAFEIVFIPYAPREDDIPDVSGTQIRAVYNTLMQVRHERLEDYYKILKQAGALSPAKVALKIWLAHQARK